MKELVFRALADPTRCRIIELLARGDLTAGEIAGKFPIAFASVSHHLKALKAAGLAAARRDGRHVRYRLEVAGFEAATGFLLDVMAQVGAPGAIRT